MSLKHGLQLEGKDKNRLPLAFAQVNLVLGLYHDKSNLQTHFHSERLGVIVG